MKERFKSFFNGRQGMDEFSKFLFWNSITCFCVAVLAYNLIPWSAVQFLASLLSWIAIFQFIFCFIRAFSRNISRRELENAAYLKKLDGLRQAREGRKDRRSQRKDYCFFRCPGCKTWLRVPRGKGKIHIKCKCGYTLYRKT